MTQPHSLDVTIDLDNLARNYELFRSICPSVQVAAVVKANAYGVGLPPVARVLAAFGCRTFFVAHLQEAAELRSHVQEAEIYVLNGLLPSTESAYKTLNVKPVITCEQQARMWLTFCENERWSGGAALHVDTGINRLGFRLQELSSLQRLIDGRWMYFDLILSHLACADVPADTRNQEQIARFHEVRREFSSIKRASLAATAGCFLGSEAQFDMVRPGIGLYGGNPFSDEINPFLPVVSAHAVLLQIKTHRSGEFIGYGRAFRLDRDTLTGVISIGYADGYPRHPSVGLEASALRVYFKGRPVRIIGRVSMDTSIVDLSSIANLAPVLGDRFEVCGASQSLDDLAKAFGSIPNEVLTSLGLRSGRRYVSGKELTRDSRVGSDDHCFPSSHRVDRVCGSGSPAIGG